MPLDSPVRGNTDVHLSIAIGAGAAVLYNDNAKSVRITSEDKDDSDLTFAEAAQGETKDYSLVIRAVQATAVGSLWRLLWDNPGAELTIVYGPHGNATASVAQPHFLMVVKNDGRPELGNEARRGKDREEFEVTLEVLDGPTLDDGVV